MLMHEYRQEIDELLEWAEGGPIWRKGFVRLDRLARFFRHASYLALEMEAEGRNEVPDFEE